MVYEIQKTAKVVGESGCYDFSLLKVGERIKGDALDALLEISRAMSVGTIRKTDAYVNNADAFLAQLTGENDWTVVKAGTGADSAGIAYPLPLDYVCQPGEYDIVRYERDNPEGGAPLAHFGEGNGRGGIAWDPYGDSLTFQIGHLVSRRIIRRKTA